MAKLETHWDDIEALLKALVEKQQETNFHLEEIIDLLKMTNSQLEER